MGLDTDFGDLVKQQPPPITMNESEAVTPYLIKRLREHVGARNPELIAVLLRRRDSGVEKYGTELMTYNGRDALVDAFQEQLDSCVYLAQHVREIEFFLDAEEARVGCEVDKTPLFMAEERLSTAIQLMVELWTDLAARYDAPEDREEEGPSIILP